MTDVVDAKTRSRMMAGIHNKKTKPELLVRKALFAAGFRYRLHDRKLPGRPDLVLPKYRAVVFVNGCFWHGHQCSLFRWPATRAGFWRDKITGNQERDARNIKKLFEQGWREMVVWECALKGPDKRPLPCVVTQIVDWLNSNSRYAVAKGESVEPG